jgi:hypothetical protein
MKVKILKSESFKRESADLFGGSFTSQGWVMQVKVIEGIGTLKHGHRDSSVNYSGQTLTLVTDGVSEQPELRWVRYCDGTPSQPVEVVE